nr:MAG TPA: Poly(A) RNA polymerase gld-2 [Bacteriophage sp.]
MQNIVIVNPEIFYHRLTGIISCTSDIITVWTNPFYFIRDANSIFPS